MFVKHLRVEFISVIFHSFVCLFLSIFSIFVCQGAITCEGCKVSRRSSQTSFVFVSEEKIFRGFFPTKYQRTSSKSLQMYGQWQLWDQCSHKKCVSILSISTLYSSWNVCWRFVSMRFIRTIIRHFHQEVESDVKVIYSNITCVREKISLIFQWPLNFSSSGMMLQRNGQVPNATILHQMVHSTSSNTRTRTSNRKRNISESTSSDSECQSKWKENDELFTSVFLVETSISTPMHFEDQIDRQSKELISIVHQAFKETLEVKRRKTNIEILMKKPKNRVFVVEFSDLSRQRSRLVFLYESI